MFEIFYHTFKMGRKKLIVIGGGAAGFFCAVNAARMCPDLQVLLLEKTMKLLSKVKVSGGGRCNLTNACFDINEMAKQYPRGTNFLKKSFHLFFTTDTIKWFEERGVASRAEADGRMFPATNSSQTVIDCLLKEANQYKVEILMNREVKGVKAISSGFEITCSNSELLRTDFLCVAAGGFPKFSMFNWLRDMGHTIEEPVPSLFTFNLPNHPLTKLMGISVAQVNIKLAGTKLNQSGPLLITHWGVSGPATLKLSAWAAKELASKNYHCTVIVNWLPEYNENSLPTFLQQIRIEYASQKIISKPLFQLPARLWDFLCFESGVQPTMRWADLPATIQNKLVKNLCHYELPVQGKTTFKEEFVTAGGIKLNEIDPQTMMSKKVSHLYFAGEIIDVDGITGGYNFQNAWTGGWIAAKHIAASAL